MNLYFIFLLQHLLNSVGFTAAYLFEEFICEIMGIFNANRFLQI